MFIVDSNHWLFYFDAAAPEHPQTVGHLDRLLDTEELLQSTVIQLEVAHAAYRKWGRNAAAMLGVFLGIPTRLAEFRAEDVGGTLRVLDDHPGSGIGARDAAILHAAHHHGATLLCTGDRALARVARKRGLQVRDLTS